ncbi:MAG: hypothetical protein RLY43_2405 [Bacteroidota bacterium]|jgi:UDP-glucuronate 4-epimerase
MKILVTGCAGFIGMHVCKKLLDAQYEILGIDSLNSYYDISLKEARLDNLKKYQSFKFFKFSVSDRNMVDSFFKTQLPDIVIHLAAQAGVRYSVDHPEEYIDSNIVGFSNILEGCRNANVGHLIYASSSSVYGVSNKTPYSENDVVDKPVSLYAATKKSNELMAYAYSHLYGIPVTGLRFFTVYGPWGRPDMSPFLFTEAILNRQPIKIFNNGKMSRDFTYIDDVIDAVVKLIEMPPPKKYGSPPYSIFNIGNSQTTSLMNYVDELENAWGRKTTREFLPMQLGDVYETMANISKLESWTGFRPKTSLKEGVQSFVRWYKNYYQIV